jgi:hypothetical protein
MKDEQTSTSPIICTVGTVENAYCLEGVCQCKDDYFANEANNFCVYCPSPYIWDEANYHCGDKNYWYGDDERGWCVRCEVQVKVTENF